MKAQQERETRLAGALGLIGVGLGLVVAARQLDRSAGEQRPRQYRPRRVSKTFTVNRSPQDVAQRWIELQMLPQVDTVRFDAAPGGRGTEIRVRFEPKWIGALRADKVQEQLRQFKQLVETGEVARSDGRASLLRPAQPLLEESFAGAGGGR